MADLTQAVRATLAICTALAALAAFGLLSAQDYWLLFGISLCHAAALAPTTTLADALAIGAAGEGGRKRFEYGWVRGTGSAVFIAGTLLAGQVVSGAGLASIVVLQMTLLAAAAGAALLVPELARRPSGEEAATAMRASARGLWIIPQFRRLVLVAALVLGSHAMHDAFAVIRWSAAGISPALSSALWSEAVAAEVIVFFVIGPPLVERLGPAGAAALAASAGVVRWTVMAQTSDVLALMLVQPLHGLTFALLHLACMQLIAATVPSQVAATAQAVYALGAGAATAVLTLASGSLYARLGPAGFAAMAALCLAALPLTQGLRLAPNAGTAREQGDPPG
jgi:PPP family 3-phenylpropionic acid transporter